jgi:hypothetical protein
MVIAPLESLATNLGGLALSLCAPIACAMIEAMAAPASDVVFSILVVEATALLRAFVPRCELTSPLSVSLDRASYGLVLGLGTLRSGAAAAGVSLLAWILTGWSGSRVGVACNMVLSNSA